MTILTIIVVFLLNMQTEKQGLAYIYQNIDKIPKAQTVMVLGASVRPDKTMSDMLKDRADTAIDLYKASKVENILVSGDGKSKNYNEVEVVNSYLLEQGIPKEKILLDYYGLDTYDSLYRAKNVFNIKSLIISTQNFHLPRAIFIAQSLELTAYGITADKHNYKNMELNIGRELLATIKAYFDVFDNAKPAVLGN
ncbi:MAG: ElyC/SanA/YdcF family protein [Candidatus Pacebacteria bacterium]|nr:ElyC/SanA/YdcF family protein [Candidatus Paceibacterota bacterium]